MNKFSPSPLLLGVNIDHIATLRQVRNHVNYPDPIQAAYIAEQAGADGITVHLREDRRHIQDRDVHLLRQTVQSRLNLEIAMTDEMLSIAEKVRPQHVCLVPERRQELTTEGGLEVAGQLSQCKDACQRLKECGIQVSLFIDPSAKQIDAAVAAQAPTIEIHTGAYAEALDEDNNTYELKRIHDAAYYAHQQGLIVNAGHGLHYHNVGPIASISVINELNIGHSIVARACMTGLAEAVSTMKNLMWQARL